MEIILAFRGLEQVRVPPLISTSTLIFFSVNASLLENLKRKSLNFTSCVHIHHLLLERPSPSKGLSWSRSNPRELKGPYKTAAHTTYYLAMQSVLSKQFSPRLESQS